MRAIAVPRASAFTPPRRLRHGVRTIACHHLPPGSRATRSLGAWWFLVISPERSPKRLPSRDRSLPTNTTAARDTRRHIRHPGYRKRYHPAFRQADREPGFSTAPFVRTSPPPRNSGPTRGLEAVSARSARGWRRSSDSTIATSHFLITSLRRRAWTSEISSATLQCGSRPDTRGAPSWHPTCRR